MNLFQKMKFWNSLSYNKYTPEWKHCQKEHGLFGFFEPLILYFVLFFPGFFSGGPVSGPIPFSTPAELNRLLFHTLPSTALLWYLVLEKRSLPPGTLKKPRLREGMALLIGFPGLILIGTILALLSSLGAASPPPQVEAPRNPSGWVVMLLSCLGTGFLEESFFRFYLLNKLNTRFTGEREGLLLSTTLFALCHIYEGPWGVLNAALAGCFLSILFLKYRSLYGAAAAHGFYNIFVYVMGRF
jgi:membrane protease YdiL (CAAX protease family)